LEDDFETLHTTLGPHPMALIKQHFLPCSVPVEKFMSSQKLAQRRNGESVFVCGFIIVRQSPPTAKGMTFLSLEDETGLINVIVQPPIYEAYRMQVTANSLVCCRGTLQLNGTQNSVVAREFFALALSQKWKQEYPTVESKMEDIPLFEPTMQTEHSESQNSLENIEE
jgi:error-prone DNA polymerase